MNSAHLSAGKTEALVNKIGGVDGVDKILSGEWVVGEPRSVRRAGAEIIAGLLEVVGEPIEVSADPRFVARDRFVLGHDGDLALSYIGEDFTEYFLGLVEEVTPEASTVTLTQHQLIKSSIDEPIFAALGGHGDARISLAHVFEFLKVADRTRWFFFYVADVNGQLWAVDTYWRDGGWDLEAYSVTYPRGWRGGGCVVTG